MRILHVSDTHLGYGAYNKIGDDGLNQREVDVYNAFTQIMDMALKEKVDAVLHSGDLFDSVRPSNRAVAHAMEQISRLRDEEVPFIVISGNHSTPRLRETGSVYSILSILSNVYAAYRGAYQEMVVGDLHVHAIPHCPAKDGFKEELGSLKPSSKGYQVATLHSGIVGVDVFTMGQANENVASIGPLTQRGFDYVAMGHYHKHTEVADNVVYSGSTERFSFSEAHDPKGCVLVDLDKHKWSFKEIDTRSMIDIGPLDAGSMAPADLMQDIMEKLEKRPLEDSIVRLTVDNVTRSTYKALDHKGIKAAASSALFFQPRFKFKEEGQQVSSASMSIQSLRGEYDGFMEKYSIEGLDKKRIVEMGKDYLSKTTGGGL